jgi:hypothetical protein
METKEKNNQNTYDKSFCAKLKMITQNLGFCIHPVIFIAFIVIMTGCARDEIAIKQKDKFDAQVAYPLGYRSWSHAKSMAILEGHKYFNLFGGIHHIYANDAAFAALEKGEPFPKGAVFVFDLLEAITEDNTVTEGIRQVIGVMEKDPARFGESEGWGFEDFKFIDGEPIRQVTDARKQCLSCHESQKASDYVYTTYRK